MFNYRQQSGGGEVFAAAGRQRRASDRAHAGSALLLHDRTSGKPSHHLRCFRTSSITNQTQAVTPATCDLNSKHALLHPDVIAVGVNAGECSGNRWTERAVTL